MNILLVIHSYLQERKIYHFFLSCILLAPGYTSAIQQKKTMLEESAQPVSSKRDTSSQLIPFSFEKKGLLSLINKLAKKKRLIVVLPTGAGLEALKKQRITYDPEGSSKVTLEQAWQLLITFIDLSGFALTPKKKNIYTLIDTKIVGNDSANRTTLTLYVDTPPYKLPPYPERIRYLYSLKSTLKVPQPQEQATHPLTSMLKQLLSPSGSFLFEPNSNSIIITDKAPHIASAIAIMQHIESREFEEQVDYIPLHYVPASRVIQIFDTLKKASGDLSSAEGPVGAPQNFAPSYFAQDVRIIAHESNNALIAMGKESSVSRISDFIKNSIDQAPESGNSILHHYDLQFLDAQEFAPQLQDAVSMLIPQGTQAGQTKQEGFERYLQGVQVFAEALVEVQKPPTTEKELLEQKGGLEVTGIEGQQKIGGNRLIVAATHDDWLVVKKLIEKLDIKRRQVLLEMYIIDFTYQNQTILSSDLRNKTDNCASPSGVQFLASHISPPTDVLGSTPVQLAQDLLQLSAPNPLINSLTPGSLLISFNDPVTPGVFGLLQLLQRVITAKIQSHPYLVITDHHTGSIESEEIRFIQGDLVTTTNGTFTIPLENVSAGLKIVATPHIASDNRLRLEISFTADEFISTNSNTRLTRELRTTATLASGQILAMGGLLRNDTLGLQTFTPIAGKVPLAGVFFRGENKDSTVTNIVLLASPIIIEPRKSHPLKKQVIKEKVAEVILHENIQTNPRDPLYSLFFKDEPTKETIDEYFLESSNVQDLASTTLHSPKLIAQKKQPVRDTKPFFMHDLKELLAYADTPPLRRTKSPLKGSIKV